MGTVGEFAEMQTVYPEQSLEQSLENFHISLWRMSVA